MALDPSLEFTVPHAAHPITRRQVGARWRGGEEHPPLRPDEWSRLRGGGETGRLYRVGERSIFMGDGDGQFVTVSRNGPRQQSLRHVGSSRVGLNEELSTTITVLAVDAGPPRGSPPPGEHNEVRQPPSSCGPSKTSWVQP